MIITVKKGYRIEHVADILKKISDLGGKAEVVNGHEQITISILGKTEKIQVTEFQSFAQIEYVFRVSKPFKLAEKRDQLQHSTVRVKGVEFSSENFIIMAGPCSVESEDQTLRIARAVKKAGANVLRGGVFKPRSSPYSFQGLGLEGLKILALAAKETGMPIISEAMSERDLNMMMDYVDIIQIGARNMQNFSFLKVLGTTNKPVLLKRGPSATIEEWLMSAEYILSGGNSQVMLCERGIRSFDSQYSRNVLDLGAVPILKSLTHLPVIVDPSHGTGYRNLVAPMALAGMASGADAIIVEVHDRPHEALSDGPQALLPSDFSELMVKVRKLATVMDRKLIAESVKPVAS